jgi:hypothetical protein
MTKKYRIFKNLTLVENQFNIRPNFPRSILNFIPNILLIMKRFPFPQMSSFMGWKVMLPIAYLLTLPLLTDVQKRPRTLKILVAIGDYGKPGKNEGILLQWRG